MRSSAILLVCLVLLSGCSRVSDKDISAAKETIEQYDTLLARGLSSMNIEQLKPITTANHQARLEHRLEGLRTGNRKMESILTAREYIDFKFASRSEVRVTVKEAWAVRHKDLKSGKLIKEIPSLSYVLAYTLRNQNAVWLIDSVDIINEKAE